MAIDMLLHKTELARATLARTGTELGRRERQVLILSDGHRSLDAIVSMLGVESLGMIQALIAAGYLVQGDTAPAASAAPAATPGKGLFGRIGEGVRNASPSTTAPAGVAPPAQPAPPVAAPAPAPRPAAASRRTMAACKMYMIDMLQLQRTPEAASLSVALQTAGDDDERALAIIDALAWLRTATKASVCGRVAERLKEIIPEVYLAGLEAAWEQMNSAGTEDASNVVALRHASPHAR